MRILFVIRSLGIGGAERQCCNVAIGLQGKGHTVLVCTLADGGALTAELGVHGVRHIGLGHQGPKNLFKTGNRLRAAVKDFSPDVIYSFMPVSNVLCAWFLPRRLQSRLVWGLRASNADLPGYGLFPRVVLKLERLCSRIPRMFIANSQSGAAYHVSTGFPQSRMRVVENSIDTAKFAYDAGRRKLARIELGVGDARKVVLIVARIDLIKGYETFISAVAAVAARRDDVEFWSVGGGDPTLKKDCLARAHALGIDARLKWFGEIRDIERVVTILAASDLSISASLSEGFPNSIAESLACGLRVVGTDVGDTRRLIAEHGESVAPGDAAAMAAAILRELERAPMRNEVRLDFLARFDPVDLLQRHERLLLEVSKGVSP